MKKKILISGRETAVFIALILMIVLFTIIDPAYIRLSNLIDIIKQATINGILAIAITFAIISGGIDLSLGCTFAIVIVAVGELTVLGFHPVIAILIGALIGWILGSINGVLVSKMKLQPFIATLATMSVYRGLAYVTTGGWPILGVPNKYRHIFTTKIFGSIPISVFVFIAIAVFADILLRKTKYGNQLFAVGGNEEAAKLSGINVDKVKIIAYSLCGFCIAFAGMIYLANLGSGEPASGQGYETDAIAATAIGGTRMSGGKGTILGTVLGALLLAALKIGLIITGVSTFWQYIVTGIIIGIAAYFETFQVQIAAFIAKRRAKK